MDALSWASATVLTALLTSGCGPPAAVTGGSTARPEPRGIRLSVLSHCGVHNVWVKDRLWLASPPLGGHNPPDGWDENSTAGSFVITRPGHAVFYGDGGTTARFRLAEPGEPDPVRGCE